MSRQALVVRSERVSDPEAGVGLDVVVDPGGVNTTTAPHYANVGDDAPPLPGDYAALGESSGTGAEHITGYADTKNAGKALPGEKRIYARSATGDVKVELWLKGDGSIVISNGEGSFAMAPSGDVTINGVVISKAGAISAPGEVTAMAATPATAISLTKHAHLTAGTGAPSGPVPFPIP